MSLVFVLPLSRAVFELTNSFVKPSQKGIYDLDNHRTTKARPDAYIFPNKLRLSYKERTGRDYDKKWPEPPGVDFARNGSTGPVRLLK